MSVATSQREEEGAESCKYLRREVVKKLPGQGDPGLEDSE